MQCPNLALIFVISSIDPQINMYGELLAKFDDPRSTFSIYGGDPKKYPWSTELKRRIHSETLLTSQKPFESLSHENQKLVLQILTDVICNSSSPSNLENSQDLVWVAQLINESDIFKVSGTADIMELLAQLHVYYGLTHEEKQMPSARAIRTASRCFVYDLRNYKEENVWGHFRLDQAGKVSWVHIDHIINVITMNLDDVPHLPGWMRPPTGLKAVRLYSAPAVETSMIDWAGVESWYRYVCFMDYRDLYALNFSTSKTEPLSTTILEEEGFEEAIKLVPLYLRVVGYSPCATQPHRPVIKFVGISKESSLNHVDLRLEGTVSMTADGQIWWKFISDGEAQWCSKGIQVGSMASAMGVVGTWTGEAHSERDPVGPFWLWKVVDTV